MLSTDRRRWRRRGSWGSAGRVGLLVAALVAAAGARPAQAITFSFAYAYGDHDPNPNDPGEAMLKSLVIAAGARWSALITDPWGIHVVVLWNNPGRFSEPTTLADALVTAVDGGTGRPTEGRIRFNNGKNWYFDDSPHNDSEYDMHQTLYRDLPAGEQSGAYNGSPPPVLEAGYHGAADAQNGWDFLTVAMHEFGHVLGMSAAVHGHEVNDDHDYDVRPSFVGGATMAIDEGGRHIFVDDALMHATVNAAVRHHPSATDIFAVAEAANWNDIELQRRDFLGGTDLNAPAAWTGGKTPQGPYDAYVRDNDDGHPFAVTTASMVSHSLSVLEGSQVITNHTLDVHGTTTIEGWQYAPSRIKVKSNGSLETFDLAIGPNGVLELRGDGISGGYAGVDGNAHVAAAGRIEGEGMMLVKGKLANDGLIRADGYELMLTTTSSGAIWDLDGAGGGALEVIDGDMFIYGAHIGSFHGNATIGGDRTLDVAHPWWVGSGGALTLDPSLGANTGPATLLSADTVLRGSVVVRRGTGIVDGKTTFQAPVQVSVTGVNDTLELHGDTTFAGGTYTGSGTIKQRGNIDVDSDTTIDVATYDWGNSNIFQPNETVVSAGATLTINSPTTGTSGNPYHGVMLVSGGTLIVNTASYWTLPEPTGGPMWYSGGTLNLIESGGQPARVQGQPLMAKHKIDAILGTCIIEAYLVTTPAAEIQVRNAAELQLAGPTTLNGGNIHGDGTLSQHGDITVTGDTTISTAVFDWGNSSGTALHTLAIQPGARLNVNSPTTGDGTNSFRGAIDIDSGTLAVNTLTSWTLTASGGATLPEGALTLSRSGPDKPSVTGIATMVVGGALNINADEAFFESTMMLLGGTVTFLANGQMQHVAPVELHGGTFDHTDKAGWLRTSPSASLSWARSANVTVEGTAGGSLTFDLATGTTVAVPTFTPTLTIEPGATVNVAGGADPFTDSLDPSRHVDVVNNSTTSLNVVTTAAVGTLSGAGNTHIGAGASLSAASVSQNRVTIDPGGTLHLSQPASSIAARDELINAGTMTFSGDVDVHGNVANTRDILVSPGSTARFFDAVAHTGQVFIPAASTAEFLGHVTGTGRFTGDGTVVFLGKVSPGNSIGRLVIEGDAAFGHSSVLEMEIGGTPPDVQCDQIVIDGFALLAGTMKLITLPGLQLEAGQALDLLTIAEGWTGSFVVDTSGVESRFLFDVVFFSDAVRLNVVAIPEPATLALLAVGGLALLRRRRKAPSTK